MQKERDTVRSRSARDIRDWDLEADVVVVGYGGAGVGAAIEAASAGADTLVLERAGGPGGSSILSGGYVYAGGGTSLQTDCGFEDTAEDMYEFLVAATGPNPNTDKLRVYADESVQFFDWLVDQGIEYKPAFYDKPTWQITGEYGLGYSGGENAHPWDKIARPAPRAHVPYKSGFEGGGSGAGSVVMERLLATAESLGVKREFDVRVGRLIEDDGGRIVGVEARRYGKNLLVRARRGVILTAGGFMNDPRMKERHAPHLLGAHLVGTEGDDGRGIRMAQAVGASVQMMDRAECAFGIDAELLVRSMVVNKQGQRFMNEDTYPGRIGQAILAHQGRQAYVVFDEQAMDQLSVDGPYTKVIPTWVSESLTELEELSGIAEGALELSVAYYNKYAGLGRDPQHGKNPKWLRPLEPPYGVVEVPATRMACFTLGGLVTRASGEVLDLDDEPIAGLYAAGRTASGIPAYGYLSGASLGDSIFFGRKAGLAAAT